MNKNISEFKNKSNYLSDEYIHVNSCGKNVISDKCYAILRTKGRVDYHFLYVSSGAIEAEIDNNIEIIGKNSLILYKPNEKQFYRFFTENTISYWLHFSGIGAEEILKRANLWVNHIYNLRQNSEVVKLFEELIKEYTMKPYQYLLSCQSKIIQLITTFSRLSDNEQNMKLKESDNIIYCAIENMRENYKKQINIDNLAKNCGLSKFRFCHLFKEVTGLAPHSYLIKIKLSKAAYLVRNTNLSINEISDLTGFNDSLYFSRLFKKNYSVSPINYRKLKMIH